MITNRRWLGRCPQRSLGGLSIWVWLAALLAIAYVFAPSTDLSAHSTTWWSAPYMGQSDSPLSYNYDGLLKPIADENMPADGAAASLSPDASLVGTLVLSTISDSRFVAADSMPAGVSVFWSGGAEAKAAATEWASADGGTTLGMTEAGRTLESTTAGMDWSEARPLWEAASRDFAANASGEVKVFHAASGVNITSIWAQTEYPTLLANPNVTGIDYLTVGAGAELTG